VRNQKKKLLKEGMEDNDSLDKIDPVDQHIESFRPEDCLSIMKTMGIEA
jgi:hypothetical protein